MRRLGGTLTDERLRNCTLTCRSGFGITPSLHDEVDQDITVDRLGAFDEAAQVRLVVGSTLASSVV